MEGIWKPIETAPKDGTQFLCYRDGDIANAWWTGDVLGGRGWSYAKWSFPTHWMPLPKTPEEQSKMLFFGTGHEKTFEEGINHVIGALFPKGAE